MWRNCHSELCRVCSSVWHLGWWSKHYGPCDSVWCYVKGPGPLTFGFKTLLKELDFSQTDATTIHADNQS